jgi:clan AA aspartic protease
MGEVRVKAKLTNGFDESLLRRGMLAPDQVRTYEADAVVDTGSVFTVLPREIAERLGVAIRGERVISLADGRDESVSLTEPIVVEIGGREALEEAVVLGDEVLVGQVALEKMDFLVDCKGGRIMPNPKHGDRPRTRV